MPDARNNPPACPAQPLRTLIEEGVESLRRATHALELQQGLDHQQLTFLARDIEQLTAAFRAAVLTCGSRWEDVREVSTTLRSLVVEVANIRACLAGIKRSRIEDAKRQAEREEAQDKALLLLKLRTWLIAGAVGLLSGGVVPGLLGKLAGLLAGAPGP